MRSTLRAILALAALTLAAACSEITAPTPAQTHPTAPAADCQPGSGTNDLTCP
jgi:hypothetical protein